MIKKQQLLLATLILGCSTCYSNAKAADLPSSSPSHQQVPPPSPKTPATFTRSFTPLTLETASTPLSHTRVTVLPQPETKKLVQSSPEQEVLPTTQSVARRQCIDSYKQCGREVLNACTIPLGALAFWKLQHRIPPSMQAGLGTGCAMVTGFMWDKVWNNTFKRPYQFFGSQVSTKIEPPYDQRCRRQLQELEQLAAQRKDLDQDSPLNPKLDKLIKKGDRLINRFPSNEEDYMYKETKKELDKVLTKLKTISKQPLQAQRITPAEFQQAFKTFAKQIAIYPPEVQENLQRAFFRIGLEANTEKPRKTAFLFSGPAGTGKTTTAVNIANAYELACKPINLTKEKSSLFDTSQDQKMGEKKPKFKPGLIAAALTTPSPKTGASITNPVLIFDEVHEVLNGEGDKGNRYTEFKKLLDDNNAMVRDDSLGVDIGIGRTNNILITNEPFEKDRAGALADRLVTIDFPALSAESKRSMADAFLKEEYARIHKDTPNTELDNVVLQSKKILDEMVQQDTNPGVRDVQKKIRSYLADLELKKKAQELLAGTNEENLPELFKQLCNFTR